MHDRDDYEFPIADWRVIEYKRSRSKGPIQSVPPKIPPEQMRFWGDIANKEWFKNKAARAPRSAIDRGDCTPDEALCLKAKEIYDGIADGSSESRFLELARDFLGRPRPENAYTAVDYLAEIFALNFENLKAWLKWKDAIPRGTRRPRENP